MTVRTVGLPEGFCLAALVTLPDPPPTGFGGFAIPLVGASTSVTETVREGTPLVGALSGDRPVALIPPGTYSLWLWVSSQLHPFTEWAPADPVQYGCRTDVTVVLDRRTDVLVTDIPAWQGDRPCG